MRQDWSHLESYRVRSGDYASDPGDHFGFFVLGSGKRQIRMMASDGGGEIDWEHVSVSVMYRNNGHQYTSVMPTWDDMCRVKDLFWDESECVVQFHPPKEQYVNTHAKCLHLWRKIGQEFETPPMIAV